MFGLSKYINRRQKGSPLILGVGKNEFIIASDAAAIIEHTSQAVYLADGEMVTIFGDSFSTKTTGNEKVNAELKEIEISLDQIELEGFNHYMQKKLLNSRLIGDLSERAC